MGDLQILVSGAPGTKRGVAPPLGIGILANRVVGFHSYRDSMT